MWTMNHPSAPLRNGDTATGLGREFRDRQRSQTMRLSVRSRARQAKTALLASILAVAAVVAVSVLEHQAFHWFSPLWEVLLLGMAGYTLARVRGGFLNGTGLFGLAYMGAIFLRELGFDSSVVVGHLSKERIVSLHGDFAVLLVLTVCGGLIGFITDRR